MYIKSIPIPTRPDHLSRQRNRCNGSDAANKTTNKNVSGPSFSRTWVSDLPTYELGSLQVFLWSHELINMHEALSFSFPSNFMLLKS